MQVPTYEDLLKENDKLTDLLDQSTQTLALANRNNAELIQAIDEATKFVELATEQIIILQKMLNQYRKIGLN